ncbi:ABC transporter substrate-binding protein [Nitratireductor aquimarinus]|uniref:ABC transporter substrate-binding protein n=1 Tax=Nitratireductor aquimarinus TaxID=889300 RepID=A0ABU4AQU9_9HYPH|nr:MULTISPECIES: ABC transporter substrate-binding protein [Nitratireductor]MDV6228589.1 ABC transporter substrate-binding protein [Nitratireductor aquimarinus]
MLDIATAGRLALCLTLGSPVIAHAQQAVPPIEILTTTEAYDPIRYEGAYIIADAWRELGLDVTVSPTEFSTLLNKFYDQQDFSVVIAGWSGRVARLDPQFFLGTLYSENAVMGANNPGGYENAEYDRLFEQQSREFDQAKRQEIVHRLQEIAAPDAPLVVLFQRDEVVAYNNKTFENMNAMPGEALYSEWVPMQAKPLTERKTLRYGGPQSPDNINPMLANTVWAWKWMRLYYDRLVRLTPEVEAQNWMAESITSVDETTIEVKLREGLTFHDGEPVTAEDVKFSFDYLVGSDYGYFNSYLTALDTVEVIDPLTVRFNLSEPSAPFTSITLSQISILPKHIWEKIENPMELAPADIPTVGSGPFKFNQYSPGEFMKLDKNPDHFHADEIAVDAIEFQIFADSEGVFTAIQTGQIDVTAWRMEAGQIPLAEENTDLNVVSVPDFGYYHLTYNLREPHFDDVEFRRALTQAVDRERIVNVLLDGRGEVGSGVIAPVNSFWHNPFTERFEHDPEAARAALEAAGYTWSDDGKLQK